jgi:hypothetical protein
VIRRTDGPQKESPGRGGVGTSNATGNLPLTANFDSRVMYLSSLPVVGQQTFPLMRLLMGDGSWKLGWGVMSFTLSPQTHMTPAVDFEIRRLLRQSKT